MYHLTVPPTYVSVPLLFELLSDSRCFFGGQAPQAVAVQRHEFALHQRFPPLDFRRKAWQSGWSAAHGRHGRRCRVLSYLRIKAIDLTAAARSDLDKLEDRLSANTELVLVYQEL